MRFSCHRGGVARPPAAHQAKKTLQTKKTRSKIELTNCKAYEVSSILELTSYLVSSLLELGRLCSL